MARAGEIASRRLLKKVSWEKPRLLKQSMYGTRDAASNWERDWQGGYQENWGNELVRSSRTLFHNKQKKTSDLTHGDDFVVTGTQESLLEPKKQLESACPITASISGAASATCIKALNRRVCWGETGILYQHDPRHVDVLVESLGLENENIVQTPMIDDAKDENAWLDPDQISKYRSHVARCLFLSQDRADRTFAVNELCQETVRSFTTQLFQIEATWSVLEGRETMDPSCRIRGHELRSDGTLGLRLGRRQRNAEVVKCGGSHLWGDTV